MEVRGVRTPRIIVCWLFWCAMSRGLIPLYDIPVNTPCHKKINEQIDFNEFLKLDLKSNLLKQWKNVCLHTYILSISCTWKGMSSVCLYSLHLPPTCSSDWELNTVRCRPETRQTSIQLREVSLLLNLILGTQLSDWEWNKTFIQFAKNQYFHTFWKQLEHNFYYFFLKSFVLLKANIYFKKEIFFIYFVTKSSSWNSNIQLLPSGVFTIFLWSSTWSVELGPFLSNLSVYIWNRSSILGILTDHTDSIWSLNVVNGLNHIHEWFF